MAWSARTKAIEAGRVEKHCSASTCHGYSNYACVLGIGDSAIVWKGFSCILQIQYDDQLTNNCILLHVPFFNLWVIQMSYVWRKQSCINLWISRTGIINSWFHFCPKLPTHLWSSVYSECLLKRVFGQHRVYSGSYIRRCTAKIQINCLIIVFIPSWSCIQAEGIFWLRSGNKLWILICVRYASTCTFCKIQLNIVIMRIKGTCNETSLSNETSLRVLLLYWFPCSSEEKNTIYIFHTSYRIASRLMPTLFFYHKHLLLNFKSSILKPVGLYISGNSM